MTYTGAWERYVSEVTIAGRPDVLEASATQWETALSRVDDMGRLVRELSGKSGSWQGAGAEAFRGHLAAVKKSIDDTTLGHYRVILGLRACARHLKEAMLGIPIPQWRFDEVSQLQQRAYHEGVPGQIPPFEFRRSLLEIAVRSAEKQGRTLNELDMEVIERALNEGEDRARATYEKLRAAYGREVAEMPGGTKVGVPHLAESKGKAKGTGGQQPIPPVATAQNPLNPATAPTAALPGTGVTPPNLDLPGTGVTPPDLDLPDLPDLSTGLAGIGSDFTGAGLGAGGIGGGIGGGGIGGGKLPIGESLGTPAVAMASTRPAAVATRGTGGAGSGAGARGLAGGMMPMGGMGAGAGNQSGDATRNTHLRETDDPFAPDRCLPSGVLDA